MDLSAYAGETVEISIAYASDWINPQLGVLIDDVTLPDGTSTSFESDLGGWAVTGPPAGSGPNINNFDPRVRRASQSAPRSRRPTRS